MTRSLETVARRARCALHAVRPCAIACVAVAATVATARAAPAAAPGRAGVSRSSVSSSSPSPAPGSVLSAPADSDAPPILVLASQVGDPPAAVSEWLDPLVDELERRGLAARPSTIVRVLGDRAPRPGILDRGITPGDLAARSVTGLEAYRSGAYGDAAAMLGRVVADLERNPALLALDSTNTSTVVRAYVGLALSKEGLGDHDGSLAAMTDLLRTWANPTIDYAEYGPQAEALLSAAKRASRKLGRGEIAISVADATPMVFTGNELRGTGHTTVADLIPGRLRVLIHVPRVGSRQYQVEVRAGRRTTLDVTWSIDAALTIGDAWAGLVFAREADRAREAAYAGALARRWGHAAIAVIATAPLRGEPAVIATMYRADGSIIRRAAVAVHSSESSLRALGRFLADGTSSADLETLGAPEEAGEPAADRITPQSSSADRRVPGWPFVVTGAAALAAGVVAIALDQDHGHRDATGHLTAYYRDSAAFGVAGCAVGAAAIAYGVWQWIHPRRQLMPAVSIAGQRATVAWTLTF